MPRYLCSISSEYSSLPFLSSKFNSVCFSVKPLCSTCRRGFNSLMSTSGLMLAPVSASVSLTHPKISMRAYFLADAVIEAGFFECCKFRRRVVLYPPTHPPLKSCFEQMSFGLALCALLWTARPFFFREVYYIGSSLPHPPSCLLLSSRSAPLTFASGVAFSPQPQSTKLFSVLVFVFKVRFLGLFAKALA